MRSQRVVVVGMVLLASGACRTDPAVTMLENENRQLEDVIYQQQDMIEEYRQALDGCRAAEPTPAGSAGTLEGPALAPSGRSPRGRSTEPSLPTVTEPVIEMPSGSESREFPDTLKRLGNPRESTGPAPPFVPNGGDAEPSTGPTSGASFRRGSAQVARITLPKVVAWDEAPGRSSGGQGIRVVVQPRDTAGRLVEAAAPVSVVVLDPALQGEAARVARWDFSAEEVARLFRRTSPNSGIQLEMVWPAASPANSQLRLFVRYTTDDGRKVEADQRIEVGAAAVRGPSWRRTDPDVPSPQSNRTATERPRRPPTPAARRVSPTSPRTAAVPPRAPRRPAWSPDRP